MSQRALMFLLLSLSLNFFIHLIFHNSNIFKLSRVLVLMLLAMRFLNYRVCCLLSYQLLQLFLLPSRPCRPWKRELKKIEISMSLFARRWFGDQKCWRLPVWLAVLFLVADAPDEPLSSWRHGWAQITTFHDTKTGFGWTSNCRPRRSANKPRAPWDRRGKGR